MDTLQIKYSTTGKALPPRPIKLRVPGWAGLPDLKMENGSEPQPWHCPPFAEGAAYGLEIVYPYEQECRIVNDNPNADVRIEWDHANEPGGVTGPDEFGIFAPKPSRFYFTATLIDLQVPPGYVIRTQPHPRFYTDTTGTVPAAVVGHVQSEWWPKKLFVVFKAPPPGGYHLFRKGEPYVQITVVPQKPEYNLIPMTDEENRRRRDAEKQVVQAKSFIARNMWQNPIGSEFNDHYRTLSRAFGRGGLPEVDATIAEGMEHLRAALPLGLSISDYLTLAQKHFREGKFIEAREVLFHVRKLDFNNAEAVSRLGIIAGAMGLPELAITMMSQASAMRPQNPAYRNNLGVALRKMRRLGEAESAFRAALDLDPNDAVSISNLGLAVAEQGRLEEGLKICQSAVDADPRSPAIPFRAGLVLRQMGRNEEARASFKAALELDANFAPAQEALKQLVNAI
jgi:Flp pilus assembly protein TadD